ncbi:MAG: M56 family metallopeptidase [Planctomycetota bacterium]
MNQIIHKFLIGLNNVGWGFCSYGVRMFVQSSVLIIMLIIIDFMLRKKVRAVFRYCVWMLIFIKLVLPPTLSLPTGIGYWCGSSLSPKKIMSKPIVDSMSTVESIVPDISEDYAINSKPAQARQFQTTGATISPVTPAVSNLPPITWQAIVFLIWIVGALVFSILLIQRMFFVLGLIAQSESAKRRLLETLNQCRRQVGIGRNVELKLSSNIQSPAVCGLFKPVILMPTSLLKELSNDKLRAVLIHELVHIKRYDLWVNFAQTFLQIIYFYNPFVWLANSLVRRIREQAVDESVLVAMGAKAKSYSNTLIDISEMAFFRTNFSLRLIGVAESKKALHRRIRHMLSRPIPKSAKIGVLGVVSVITLAAVLLPMAAAAKDSPKEQPQYTLKLPNGVTVELVAICEYESGSKEWWRPDGTKLAKEIRTKKGSTVAAGGKTYAVAVKVKGPEDMAFKWGKIKGARGAASLEVVDSKGQAISNMRAHKVHIDEKLTTTSIQFGAATGNWKTMAHHNGKDIMSTGIEGGGIAFSEAYESNKVVKINVSDDFLNLDHRIIAIDKEGTEHVPQNQPWTSAGKVRQTIPSFHNLRLHQIKEYQYQTRPYDWAEFKNVSLKPGLKTEVDMCIELAGKGGDSTKKSLQSVIDSAKPGDTVIVPKGIYKEPIDINKSLTLKGELRGECVFEVTADRPAIYIDTKSKGNVIVEDLMIKWQLATSSKGIERPFALGVKDTKAEIKNCSFIPLGNSQRSPVAVRVDGFSNLTISRSRFEGFEYVICYGQGTKGKTTDCLIMNCGHQGIINYSGATLHVERNVITGSKYHAVRCTGGTLHVKDNLLINNANRGIYLGNKSGSGSVSNNLIIGNSVGIGAFARAKYEITNNVIADSSYSGIGMYKSCYLKIRDNIFLNNERGWVMFDKGGEGGNTCYRNTFWKNKVDDENFKNTGNSINSDPGFIDADNGDYSLKSGPALEHKQGLTNPQLFKDLWKVWKNRKDKNVPFTK